VKKTANAMTGESWDHIQSLLFGKTRDFLAYETEGLVWSTTLNGVVDSVFGNGHQILSRVVNISNLLKIYFLFRLIQTFISHQEGFRAVAVDPI
jgi:hypothetical protein